MIPIKRHSYAKHTDVKKKLVAAIKCEIHGKNRDERLVTLANRMVIIAVRWNRQMAEHMGAQFQNLILIPSADQVRREFGGR